jgi:hypothetical protein
MVESENTTTKLVIGRTNEKHSRKVSMNLDEESEVWRLQKIVEKPF